MAQKMLIKVSYGPEGGSKREWELDLLNPARDIHKFAPKKAGAKGWVSFSEGVQDFDYDCWQALIWVLRKRQEPALQFDAVDFPTGLLNEVDVAVACQSCGGWIGDGTDDLSHTCPPAEALEGDDDPEA